VERKVISVAVSGWLLAVGRWVVRAWSWDCKSVSSVSREASLARRALLFFIAFGIFDKFLLMLRRDVLEGLIDLLKEGIWAGELESIVDIGAQIRS
jgi:hypothetical protein